MPWTVEEVERETTGWAGKERIGVEVMETVVEAGKARVGKGERETGAVSREGPVAELGCDKKNEEMKNGSKEERNTKERRKEDGKNGR